MDYLQPKHPVVSLCEELVGAHHGQRDVRLIAYADDGKVVGVVSYSLFEGDLYINFIDILGSYKRQGIGTQLIEQLTREYGYDRIKWGYLVDDTSEAFYNAMEERFRASRPVLAAS